MNIFKVQTVVSKKAHTNTMFAVCMHSYGGPGVLNTKKIPLPGSGW